MNWIKPYEQKIIINNSQIKSKVFFATPYKINGGFCASLS